MLIVIFVIFSLGKEKTTEELLTQMLYTKVDLCFSRMEYYPSSNSVTNDDMIQNCTSKYKLIVYTDSVGCTPCLVSRMTDWKDVTQEFFFDSCRSVKLIFVFSPQQSNVQRLKEAIENSTSDWAVYIDTAYVFQQENKQIPVNNRFHTFLLNEKNEILCVGNPLYNERIREICKNIIKENKSF